MYAQELVLLVNHLGSLQELQEFFANTGTRRVLLQTLQLHLGGVFNHTLNLNRQWSHKDKQQTDCVLVFG
jgi:hypothetical protein